MWIAIYSFIGNYFWTHYFYTLLKAKYTFPSWMLNGVPIPLYFMTHAYFCFYHAVSNMSLRWLRVSCREWTSTTAQNLVYAAGIFVLSYVTAYMETLTISSFKYYDFEDRDRMYRCVIVRGGPWEMTGHPGVAFGAVPTDYTRGCGYALPQHRLAVLCDLLLRLIPDVPCAGG